MTSWSARWQRLIGEGAALVQTLRDWPWFATLQTLRQRFREDRLGLTAGSLTFSTLIALVPLFSVMLAVFTAFPVFSRFRGALETYFLEALVPDAIARPVLQALTQFVTQARGIGGIGLLLFVVTAVATMLTIDRTLGRIWRVRQPRAFAQRVFVYWAVLTLGPLLVGASLTATSYAVTASTGFVGKLPAGIEASIGVVEFGLTALGAAALFHFVPNTWVRWRHALAGGFFVAAAFEAAKAGLAWYLSKVPGFRAVYGTFATVPILMLWIYLVWVIVLLGAVIAAYAPSLQMRVARRPSVPGLGFELALAVLRVLASRRDGPERGASVAQLSLALRTDPLQVEPVVEQLLAIDWVGRLDEPGGARIVLLADPPTTALQPLVERLLLPASPTTQPFRERSGVATMTLADALG